MSSDDHTHSPGDRDRPFQAITPAEFRDRFAAIADQLRPPPAHPRPWPDMAEQLRLLELYNAGFLTFAQYVARRAQLVDGDDVWTSPGYDEGAPPTS